MKIQNEHDLNLIKLHESEDLAEEQADKIVYFKVSDHQIIILRSRDRHMTHVTRLIENHFIRKSSEYNRINSKNQKLNWNQPSR